jgi:D-alanyl-D-alanine carboxypeptidase/D-alanyl-D-alanine-endopeptidase (penicillin-binding protein 4)
VKRIDGGIIGDDTWYLWQPFAEGWAIDDSQYDYGAPVSALTVNDNAVTLAVRPGAHEADPAALAWNPPLEYYRVDNRIRTVAGGERSIHFHRDPGGLEVRLWGSIPLRDRGEDLVLAIEDPAVYAAEALRQALEERGVPVGGGVTALHAFPNETPDLAQAAAPPTEVSGVELARRVSAPLIEDLRITDKVSQNLHAELALRAVARARRNLGSLEAGVAEIQAFLAEAGIDPDAYNLADGSGLARLNLVTPATVVKLLRFMYASPARDNWISLLPVGGQDGTLSARFGKSAVAGRVHAKTGSLAHVSALSGYLERPDGGWVAFSILVNNYNGRAAEVRGVMDRICTLIME